MVVLCKFYQQARCSKGAACPYAHENVSSTATPTAHAINRHFAVPDVDQKPHCTFFARGSCRNGQNCAFSHADSLPSQPLQPETENTPSRDSRATITCKYHTLGICTKGAACPFHHPTKDHPTKASDTAGTIADDLEEPNQKTDINNSKRYLHGALVHFSDGAFISSFSLASDFSAVRLDGLQATDTAPTILELASSLGFTLAEDAVRMIRDVAGNFSAVISVAEPSFATSFRRAMKTDSSPKRFAATLTVPHLPAWVVQRRVNCRKVIVSWFRPNRLVWLNFGSQKVAKRTCDKFNGGRYLVNGERVNADDPTGTRPTYRRGRGGFHNAHNAQGWTVVLKGVASHATRSDITTAIRDDYDEPHHIELDRPSFEYDPEIIPYLVESMLMSIGPLDFFTAPQLRGQRMKAIAQFASEKDARHAVKTLHEQQQKYLNGGKLYLQSRSSSKVKVSTKVFNAVRDQLQTFIPTWQAEHLTFRTYADTDPSKRFAALKLEGESIKEVAKATKLLEQLLSGRVVKDGDSSFWVESLTGNGPSYQFVKEVQKAENIMIVRDKSKKQLRVFADDAAFARVQPRLVTELERLDNVAQSSTAIQLSEQQFLWACRGGLNMLCSELGPGVAAFDVVSTPKRIIITGSQRSHQQALVLLDRMSSQALIETTENATEDQVCAICWTKPENPVSLECHHVYCLDCFEGLCTSENAASSGYRIDCQGDMGKCERRITLEELCEYLPSETFEGIFDSSFASYVRKRPNKFCYCPTPDCGFIYRTGAAILHTCTGCLEAVCTACHHQHGAMTCGEYKDIASGGYEAFEKLKKEMNIKDCPKCKTPIEKSYGCNHMTCGGCNAHICWVCMAVFGKGDEVYDHMSKAHGGFYTGEAVYEDP